MVRSCGTMMARYIGVAVQCGVVGIDKSAYSLTTLLCGMESTYETVTTNILYTKYIMQIGIYFYMDGLT